MQSHSMHSAGSIFNPQEQARAKCNDIHAQMAMLPEACTTCKESGRDVVFGRQVVIIAGMSGQVLTLVFVPVYAS